MVTRPRCCRNGWRGRRTGPDRNSALAPRVEQGPSTTGAHHQQVPAAGGPSRGARLPRPHRPHRGPVPRPRRAVAHACGGAAGVRPRGPRRLGARGDPRPGRSRADRAAAAARHPAWPGRPQPRGGGPGDVPAGRRRAAACSGVPPGGRGAWRGVLQRAPRGRDGDGAGARPQPAHHRRGDRAGHAPRRPAREEQVLHAGRLAQAGPRVPALWISERAPKLGWCWDGNPHTWLGLASAGRRVS